MGSDGEPPGRPGSDSPPRPCAASDRRSLAISAGSSRPSRPGLARAGGHRRSIPSNVGEGSFRDRVRHRLSVARGDEPADVVLTGGKILSVFTGELLEADVAFAGSYVAGMGRYEGRETFDVSGLTLLPGFIDGHMHIESTKLMVDQFARAVLPWGTTTVVIDPHEIANVFGLDGVRAMLAAAAGVPLDVFAMVSSCVPASPFESSGATVDAEAIERFLAREPRALGMAEMMN